MAQLVSASRLHREGRRFEPCSAHVRPASAPSPGGRTRSRPRGRGPGPSRVRRVAWALPPTLARTGEGAEAPDLSAGLADAQQTCRDYPHPESSCHHRPKRRRSRRWPEAQASLGVRVAVFGFDPDPRRRRPAVPSTSSRSSRRCPRPSWTPGRPSRRPGARAVGEAGVASRWAAGPRRGPPPPGRPRRPARRQTRAVTAWYPRDRPFRGGAAAGGMGAGRSGPAPGGPDTAAFRASLDRLRADSRHVAGAVALLGEVFTGDDLLRLYVALHGGPEGSERTFRRRVQELRDAAFSSPSANSEVAALRLRVPRFHSPAGHRRAASRAAPLCRRRRRAGAAGRAEDPPLRLRVPGSRERRPAVGEPRHLRNQAARSGLIASLVAATRG